MVKHIGKLTLLIEKLGDKGDTAKDVKQQKHIVHFATGVLSVDDTKVGCFYATYLHIKEFLGIFEHHLQLFIWTRTNTSGTSKLTVFSEVHRMACHWMCYLSG